MGWRRSVTVSVLLLLLAGTAGAASGTGSYETNMYPDAEGGEDFWLSGSYETKFVGQRIDILFTYRIAFVNPYYNKTTMRSFTAELRNGSGHVLTTTELSAITLSDTDNTTALKGGKLSVVTTPGRIDHVRYVINHTMTAADKSFTHAVTGGFIVDAPEREAYVRGFRTNATAVHRGDAMYVNGTSQSIENLSINGQEMDVATDGTFAGWLRLPGDLATGPHNMSYELVTEEGTYTRGLNITVVNRPPTLSINTPDTREGTNLSLTVDASDDIRVVGTTATFQGDQFTASNGTLRLPTADLTPGTYNVAVTATDTAGAQTTQNATVTVTEQEQSAPNQDSNTTDEQDQTDDSGQTDDETTSGLVNLVSEIRSFFENLLFGG